MDVFVLVYYYAYGKLLVVIYWKGRHYVLGNYSYQNEYLRNIKSWSRVLQYLRMGFLSVLIMMDDSDFQNNRRLIELLYKFVCVGYQYTYSYVCMPESVYE